MTSPFDDCPIGHRRLRRLLGGVFVAIVVGTGTTAMLVQSTTGSASAANVSFDQCNGVGGGGGQTVTCNVVIVNTLTASADTTGSVVVINGGAPVSSPNLVTTVDQCNGSAGGNGSTITCSVQVTNDIAVDSPAAATAATINQCNANQADDGLGNAPNTCSPFPADTSGATITQCNGSGNGGGLVFPSHCDASGMVSSSLPVTINQCNGSANGGGDMVNCSASMTTNVVNTSVPVSTTPTTPPTGTPGTPSGSPTGVPTDIAGSGSPTATPGTAGGGVPGIAAPPTAIAAPPALTG
jgi:hypothetical protein